MKSSSRAVRLATALVATTATAAIAATAASAATIYDNIPGPPLPGNIPSEGPEAYAWNELGGQVQFADSRWQSGDRQFGDSQAQSTDGQDEAGDRHDQSGDRARPVRVTVAMSSWACQTGHWYSGNCRTRPGARYAYPITLNLYAVNSDESPGALLGTQTRTFAMPYRPSADPACTGPNAGKWREPRTGTCFNGKAFTIEFAFRGVTLPGKAIISLAYNSTHYGYNPVGESAACYANADPNCFYDSLNVGLTSPPTVGSDPLPSDAYLYSSVPGAYCDGGAGGTNVFRRDAGCWTGYQPSVEVETGGR
jgi:hypothetical protein